MRGLAVGPGLLAIVAAFEVFDGIQTVSTGAPARAGRDARADVANLLWGIGCWGLPLGSFFVLD